MGRKGMGPVIMALFAGAVVLTAGAGSVALLEASGTTSMFNSASDTDNTGTTDPGQNYNSWSAYDDIVGVSVPNGTYDIVFITVDTEAGNFGEADVTKVGADSDENDQQELFEDEDAEQGEDYYVASDGSFSNIPESGNYQYAVIGSNTANEYGDVPAATDHSDLSIPEEVSQLRIEQGAALKLLEGEVDGYGYASGATSDTTKVLDNGDAIALDSDYSDDVSDSEVDGTVTGVKKWTVDGSSTALTFGEVSVSSVNSSVEQITVDLIADGEEVMSVSDTDFSDGEKLDDGVSVADEVDQNELFATSTEEFTVETEIEFDDSAMSNAGDLATVSLDDTDDDSTTSDGSYGISAVSETWTGY